MKCPFCGAELQENARFCFFCMKQFNEKNRVPSPNYKKKRTLWICGAVIALAIVALTFWLLSQDDKKNHKDDNSIQESSDEIIATFDDFQLRATYLTGKNGLSDLWEPDAFVMTHQAKDNEGDTWQTYATDLYIDDANMQVYFCEEGIQIITAITGLTDETMDSGLQLVDCAVSSVYNYSYTNLYDFLTDRDKYPAKEIPYEEQMLISCGLPDSALKKQDKGTTPLITGNIARVDEQNSMYVEQRTRTYEGQIYYDIFILHLVLEE